jgi:hypothetical protein
MLPREEDGRRQRHAGSLPVFLLAAHVCHEASAAAIRWAQVAQELTDVSAVQTRVHYVRLEALEDRIVIDGEHLENSSRLQEITNALDQSHKGICPAPQVRAESRRLRLPLQPLQSRLGRKAKTSR